MNHYQVAFLDKTAEIDTSLSPAEFISVALFFKQMLDLIHTQQFQIWQQNHSAWIPVHGVENMQLRLFPPDVGSTGIEILYDFAEIGDYACQLYRQYTDEKNVIEKFNKRRSSDQNRIYTLSKRISFIDTVVTTFSDEWQISFDRHIRQRHKQFSVWTELNMSDRQWKRLWRDLKCTLGREVIERADKKELAKILDESGRDLSTFKA